MMLEGCETEEERREVRDEIYRPPMSVLLAEEDDDLPDWAENYVPGWWGGHEQAEYDATQSGRITASK